MPALNLTDLKRNTYDHQFQENEGENEKGVRIIAFRILFPAKWYQDH